MGPRRCWRGNGSLRLIPSRFRCPPLQALREESRKYALYPDLGTRADLLGADPCIRTAPGLAGTALPLEGYSYVLILAEGETGPMEIFGPLRYYARPNSMSGRSPREEAPPGGSLGE
jgi:hypothetical protein